MQFEERHMGPSKEELSEMLAEFSASNLDEFTAQVVPEKIAFKGKFALEGYETALSEPEIYARAAELASENKVFKSFIGAGYYNCHVPPVIQRNILENPGWYTQYTPYQPEISQGRLEALLNFQTLVSDLTGLPISNSSLLDESTAAAEAMVMSFNHVSRKRRADGAKKFFVDAGVHPQTLAVLETRASGFGFELVVAEPADGVLTKDFFGALLQYPNSQGNLSDPSSFAVEAKSLGVILTVACDLLSLMLLKSPGEIGASVAVGSAQRFGVPMGYGGPHAAFMAVEDELKRLMPGRLVGVSKDSSGQPALRLALQTREQHIRREKATSNICTAQVLLAIMTSMYAVYHGPKRLRAMADRVHGLTASLAAALLKSGVKVLNEHFFDTITFESADAAALKKRAEKAHVNLRYYDDNRVSLSLDETSTQQDAATLYALITQNSEKDFSVDPSASSLPAALKRSDELLTHSVFNSFHSETEFLRYVKRLEAKDLSLCHSMIPLGSCTMKLNATSEMLPVTMAGFSALHPFAPVEQAAGYKQLFEELSSALAEITGFAAVSLQPNAGSQGEYAGLVSIRRYLDANGGKERDICLIPTSAHGTNPASAVMAGMKVQAVRCDSDGNIDLQDIKAKIEAAGDKLAALMITYPSTHGVFEEEVKTVCDLVHAAGGQVYLDGANLNALVGIAKPAEFGADVLHFNLHKTFCIPHGGGGPGMGPIAAVEHLAPYMPGHVVVEPAAGLKEGAVSAAPWGSASILPISWSYMKMMGADGLKRASQIAILNANYIAKRLEGHFPVLYTGQNGRVAHECIIDCRPFKAAGVEVEDIAKRLIDYGFHAPTMSWPVIGTLMIEPTESESKAELDRFCDAMIAIRGEISKLESKDWDSEDNPLKNAPHSLEQLTASDWSHSYSRELAAYPADFVRERKFWSAVGRVDSAYGDRNLVCSCPTVEELAEAV